MGKMVYAWVSHLSYDTLLSRNAMLCSHSGCMTAVTETRQSWIDHLSFQGLAKLQRLCAKGSSGRGLGDFARQGCLDCDPDSCK